MRLRIVSGGSLRVLELEDVSQVTVYTSEGDACSCSYEVADGAVLTAHGAERDFKDFLRKAGISSNTRIEVLNVT